jgi:hypothetical protein
MPNPFRIFLASVPSSVTADELNTHFSQFGHVIDVYIPMNPTTQKSKVLNCTHLYLTQVMRLGQHSTLESLGTKHGISFDTLVLLAGYGFHIF